jgi:hypothetical protein
VVRDIWSFLFALWGILGYAEDCESNVGLLARKVSWSKELNNLEGSSVMCIVDKFGERGRVGSLMVLNIVTM